MWFEIAWPKDSAPNGVKFDIIRERFVIKRALKKELRDYPLENAHIWFCAQGEYSKSKATIICALFGEPLVPMRFVDGCPIFSANRLIEIFIKKIGHIYDIRIVKHWRHGNIYDTRQANRAQICDTNIADLEKVLNTHGLSRYVDATETGIDLIEGKSQTHYFLSKEMSSMPRRIR